MPRRAATAVFSNLRTRSRQMPWSQPRPVSTRCGRAVLVLSCCGLAVSLTSGNRNDITQLLPLLDKFPAVAVLSVGHGIGPTCSSPTAVTTTHTHRWFQ